MADEEENSGDKGEEGGKKKGGKKMLILIVVAVVVLLGGGGAAFFLMSGGKDEAAEVEPQEVEVKYETFQLQPFVVNLSDNRSFLKLTLLLEYDPSIVSPGGILGGGGGAAVGGGGSIDPLTGELPGLLKDREAMMRDSILNVIAVKSREELLTAEGKEQLKEEIIEAANDASGLDEAPIVGAYFLEFIIQ
ncbi:MAG: flagellar basal body-associated FliL family protein [Bdellovibrionales bacterium]|nr:flagellar basal body-associated FliL family protein [Bdellovibrionales bacterium]